MKNFIAAAISLLLPLTAQAQYTAPKADTSKRTVTSTSTYQLHTLKMEPIYVFKGADDDAGILHL